MAVCDERSVSNTIHKYYVVFHILMKEGRKEKIRSNIYVRNYS